jgi:hypothetical protein
VDGDCALEEVGRQHGQLTPVRGEDRAASGGGARGGDALCDSEAAERVHGVCEQRDPGAGGLEPRRPLEHDDIVASTAEGDRRAQPADAAADDDHPRRAILRVSVHFLVSGCCV